MQGSVTNRLSNTKRAFYLLALIALAAVFLLAFRECSDKRNRGVKEVPLYKLSADFGDPNARVITVWADPDQLLISCDDPQTKVHVTESNDSVVLRATVPWDERENAPISSDGDAICAGPGDLVKHLVKLKAPLGTRDVLQSTAVGERPIPRIARPNTN